MCKWCFSPLRTFPPPRNMRQLSPGASAILPSPMGVCPQPHGVPVPTSSNPIRWCHRPQQEMVLLSPSLVDAQPCWQPRPSSLSPCHIQPHQEPVPLSPQALAPPLQKPSCPVCAWCSFTVGWMAAEAGGSTTHPRQLQPPQAQGVPAPRWHSGCVCAWPKAVWHQNQPLPGGKSSSSPSQSQEGGPGGPCGVPSC